MGPRLRPLICFLPALRSFRRSVSSRVVPPRKIAWRGLGLALRGHAIARRTIGLMPGGFLRMRLLPVPGKVRRSRRVFVPPLRSFFVPLHSHTVLLQKYAPNKLQACSRYSIVEVRRPVPLFSETV